MVGDITKVVTPFLHSASVEGAESGPVGDDASEGDHEGLV